jgi:CRP/FNR family transcriptional regulator, anaerobic regulatory protein
MSWIGQFPGLTGLEPEAAKLLLERPVQTAPQGTVLFEAGAVCRGFLLLLEGRVRVSLHGSTGRSIVLYRVGHDQICIQTMLCLFARKHYAAEGVAESGLKFVMIQTELFDRLLAASTIFRRYIFERLAERMADITDSLETVAFVRVDARLAAVLLRLSDSTGTFTGTHQQLADEIGSVREVVSRQLRAFEHSGWIAVHRGGVHVVDRKALEMLSRVT